MITIADLKLLIKSSQPASIGQIAFWGLVFILFGGLCFGLGRLTTLGQGSTPVTILMPTSTQSASVAQVNTINLNNVNNTVKPPTGEGSAPTPSQTNGKAKGIYVGAKTGKKYYLPTCSGVTRIKEENKMWFATKADAEAKGYTPAANCSGI